MKNTKKQQVTGWVMEMAKGRYLHINATEDGDGTWFDTTGRVWESYRFDNVEALRNIPAFEFYGFPQGYPKYHKVKFTAEVLETEVD